MNVHTRKFLKWPVSILQIAVINNYYYLLTISMARDFGRVGCGVESVKAEDCPGWFLRPDAFGMVWAEASSRDDLLQL